MCVRTFSDIFQWKLLKGVVVYCCWTHYFHFKNNGYKCCNLLGAYTNNHQKHQQSSPHHRHYNVHQKIYVSTNPFITTHTTSHYSPKSFGKETSQYATLPSSTTTNPSNVFRCVSNDFPVDLKCFVCQKSSCFVHVIYRFPSSVLLLYILLC